MSLSGITVSDLHLFTGRCAFKSYEEEFYSSLIDKDVLVLNGDIIDFKWSKYKSFNETAEKASEWLEGLSKRVPNLIYILGNHDRMQEFYSYLEVVKLKCRNFDWDASGKIVGDSLFFHGDLPDLPENLLNRDPEKLEKRKGKTANGLYKAVVKSHLIRTTNIFNKPLKTCKMLHEYAKAYEVKKVFTGHTHTPYNAVEFQGRTYYNTGSAVQNMKFNPIEFVLEES